MLCAAADGKEDGTATFAAFQLSVQAFKKDFPHVKEIKSLRTDGANAYSGVEFLMGVSLMTEANGLPIRKMHIGCSGHNKNSQDAHFATASQALDRLVSSGRWARAPLPSATPTRMAPQQPTRTHTRRAIHRSPSPPALLHGLGAATVSSAGVASHTTPLHPDSYPKLTIAAPPPPTSPWR
jgi:hypothetical protein